MKITDNYVFFYGGIYSQWYPSNFIVYDINFCTAEQFMMYNKALLFNDINSAQLIINTHDPAKQKKIGRNVKNFDGEVWNKNKLQIVYKGNVEKFKQNKHLLNQLIETEDRLFVEASPYDKIWGIGLGLTNPLIYDKNNWLGQNLLGKIITKVRNDFNKNKIL